MTLNSANQISVHKLCVKYSKLHTKVSSDVVSAKATFMILFWLSTYYY